MFTCCFFLNQLLIYSCGGTRRYQEECWELQLSPGSCSSCFSTTSSLSSATSRFLLLLCCSCGLVLLPSFTSKFHSGCLLRLYEVCQWCDYLQFYRTPPHIPEVHIPEEVVLQLASGLRIEINRGFTILRNIALGRDLKKFLMVNTFFLFNIRLLVSCFF